jgi:hypothetical protein
VVASIGEALQDAVSCGCKPGNCFWCVANEANKTLSASSVSAFDLGNNVTGQFKAPLNWNQMAGLGVTDGSSSSSSMHGAPSENVTDSSSSGNSSSVASSAAAVNGSASGVAGSSNSSSR